MNKSSILIILTLVLWLTLVVYFTSSLQPLIFYSVPLMIKALLILVYFVLSVFLLNIASSLVPMIFSCFRGDGIFLNFKKNAESHVINKTPRVALLYCTYNDFYEKSTSTCLNQDYENYHLYILDDSTGNEYRDRIDKFTNLNNDKVSVIRRENREGFKAGNMNNALRQIKDRYEYFAVIDSDSLLPKDFIKKALLYFLIDSSIAYVQANHRGYIKTINPMSRGLFLGVELHSENFPATKNQYGLNIFYGHDAMIKTKIWEEIGGFPEIVSEDLAFSVAVRAAGYNGIFAKEIVCEESFPFDYSELRRRSEKWTKGTFQFLWSFLPKYLKSSEIYWFEKLDIFLVAVRYVFNFPYLFLLLVVSLSILPDIVFKMHPSDLFYYGLITNSVNILEKKVIFFLVLIPILSFILLAFRKNDMNRKDIMLRVMDYTVYQTFFHLSSFVKTTIDIVSFILFKKVKFLPTGDKKGASGNKNSIFREDLIYALSESAGIIIFLCIGIAFRDNWLLLIGASSLLGLYSAKKKSDLDKAMLISVYFIFFITVWTAVAMCLKS